MKLRRYPGFAPLTAARRLRPLMAAMIVCMSSPAHAESFNRTCTSVPRHLWLSLQALETKVEAQGYRIQKSRLTSTCAAFEVLNADGAGVELFVDPTNGEIKGKAKPRQTENRSRPPVRHHEAACVRATTYPSHQTPRA